MKVLHVSFSDREGGAAKAAYRIHQALLGAGITSRMIVNSQRLGDWTVSGVKSWLETNLNIARRKIARRLRRFLNSTNVVLHTPAWLNSRWPQKINNSDADIVHLHWTAAEMLSIADVKKIENPLIWTIHDMWLFCGAEHYTDDFRWREGYRTTNRPPYESGFDLNRWTWLRKQRMWNRPIQIVSPSDWLADAASSSALTKGWPVSTITHPIDLNEWQHVEQKVARDLLGLPRDLPLVLFGAVGGGKDPRKGLDLFVDALKHLRQESKNLNVVIFGELRPKESPGFGFPSHYFGIVQDSMTLRLLYSACDVFVLPSRLESLGLTLTESMSYGTPVVGFNNSGLPTIIEHRETGYLAKSFDTFDLATGINWVLSNGTQDLLRLAVRKAAEKHFDPIKVASDYITLYRGLINKEEERR